MSSIPCLSRRPCPTRAIRARHRPRLNLELVEERTWHSTLRLKDLNTRTPDSSPTALVALGGQTYFEANDGSGVALYQSDGTAAHTTRLGAGLTNVQGLTVFHGALYFTAQDT